MLSCDEIAELAMALCATAEALGQPLSADAAEIMAGDLAAYSVDVIAPALQACRQELTSKLTTAAVRQRIHRLDGRPEPSEAWAIALSATDENCSVVLTQEIHRALSAARPVLDKGDVVGARMTFLNVYERLVYDSRRLAAPVSWELSQGHDPQRRLSDIEEAERLGRLPASQARRLALQLSHLPTSEEKLAVAGLLSNTPPPPNQEKHLRLRGLIAAIRRVPSPENYQP